MDKDELILLDWMIIWARRYSVGVRRIHEKNLTMRLLTGAASLGSALMFILLSPACGV